MTYVDHIYCNAALAASPALSEGARNACTDAELDFSIGFMYSNEWGADVQFRRLCGGDDPEHVCFEKGIIDLEAIGAAAEQDALSNVGETSAPIGSPGTGMTRVPEEEVPPGGTSFGDSDSAAGLVALAGVSLAAAAMLAADQDR